MANREAVTFKNKDGLRLFGILHRPDASGEKKIGIVFLSPGVKSRVGPHCLYNKMTTDLIELGYPVLRFDFYGLGDSEGELPEDSLMDLYDAVQRGRYRDDTLAAIDWFQNRLGLEHFVLAGLCGGALTGLLAAKDDRRVNGILALALPVAFDARPDEASRNMTSGQMNEMGSYYIRKLLKPSAWMRLLTFKTDYRVLIKTVAHKLKKSMFPTTTPRSSGCDQSSNINHYFVDAFFDYVDRGGVILCVFGSSDRLGWEFEEKFALPNEQKLSRLIECETHTIQGANHILSEVESRIKMQTLAKSWLAHHF